MIRRDIRLADGSAGWMLIEQVEHARLSGELAALSLGRFAAPGHPGAAPPLPAEVRHEVLTAIRRHDDGWSAWDRDPQFDSHEARPLAFTELPPAEACAVWTRSIDAAAAFGPLAGWMVAGHFLRLARHSDTARHDPAVAEWRERIEGRRTAWLDQWTSSSRLPQAASLADEALEWLWTFDEASLWFCCTCDSQEASIPCAPEPYCIGRGTPLEMHLALTGNGRASADPWRFGVPAIEVQVDGRVAPARRYSGWAELLAAATPQRLTFRLTPPPSR
ncbi:MAG TPA: DUF3891 family protein [Lacipirellulaceae bacterium]|nr:DUF3891 family protein [Lacipirellulaceae bacterium]